MPCAVLVVAPGSVLLARQSLTGVVPLQRSPSAQRFCLTKSKALHSGSVHGRHCVSCRAWRGPKAELGMALTASADCWREAAAELVAGRWTVPIALGSLALVGIWQLVAFIRRAALPDSPTCSARS